jgi:hypothetical protein
LGLINQALTAPNPLVLPRKDTSFYRHSGESRNPYYSLVLGVVFFTAPQVDMVEGEEHLQQRN